MLATTTQPQSMGGMHLQVQLVVVAPLPKPTEQWMLWKNYMVSWRILSVSGSLVSNIGIIFMIFMRESCCMSRFPIKIGFPWLTIIDFPGCSPAIIIQIDFCWCWSKQVWAQTFTRTAPGPPLVPGPFWGAFGSGAILTKGFPGPILTMGLDV